VATPGTACRDLASRCDDNTCDGTSTECPEAVTCGLANFLCYTTKKFSAGEPRFTPELDVALDDQFDGSSTVDVTKAVNLCTPATANGVPATVAELDDPDTHLEGYKIKFADATQRFERVLNAQVTNQFGTVVVDTIKPDRLLVPTNKATASPFPPDPYDDPNAIKPDVEHFQCYTVKLHPGQVFSPPTVAVVDQFSEPTGKTFKLKKISRLCNPVAKNGEAVRNQDDHLLCYQAVRVIGPKHVALASGVFLANQFGEERVKTITEKEFCVPSTKELLP
jgi:hypothetical protein